MQVKKLKQILSSLDDVKDPPEYHPERSVLHHSLQAAEIALKSFPNNLALIQAALLHDIGKSVNSLGHEKIGADILRELRSNEWSEGRCRNKLYNNLTGISVYLVENHMRMMNWENMRFSKRNALIDSPFFKDLCYLYNIDKAARKPNAKTRSLDELYKIIIEDNYFICHYVPKYPND